MKWSKRQRRKFHQDFKKLKWTQYYTPKFEEKFNYIGDYLANIFYRSTSNEIKKGSNAVQHEYFRAEKFKFSSNQKALKETPTRTSLRLKCQVRCAQMGCAGLLIIIIIIIIIVISITLSISWPQKRKKTLFLNHKKNL